MFGQFVLALIEHLGPGDAETVEAYGPRAATSCHYEDA
jgi:hypothetical protein